MNGRIARDPVLIAAAVLGGVHHFLGPLWGAAIFVLLQDRLSAVTQNRWLLFAPATLLFVLFSPEGLQGSVQRPLRRERRTLTRPGIPPRRSAIVPWPASEGTDVDKPVLSVRGLTKRFGSLVTANAIDLDVFPRRLHSVIGPNGAGKTAFLNHLTDLVAADSETILFAGRNITTLATHRRIRLGLGRSFQILSAFPKLTAFENVRVAVRA